MHGQGCPKGDLFIRNGASSQDTKWQSGSIKKKKNARSPAGPFANLLVALLDVHVTVLFCANGPSMALCEAKWSQNCKASTRVSCIVYLYFLQGLAGQDLEVGMIGGPFHCREVLGAEKQSTSQPC